MDVREKLVEIIKMAAYHCLPSNTEDFHLNMFVTNLIANGVTVQEWIPVNDRLPDTEDVFLCWSKDLADMMFCYTSDFKQMEVTHWMPLPQPPTDKSNLGGKQNATEKTR